MATVVAIVNSKGGVGKSNIAVHLSEAIRRSGRRVLLVDNDQGQASSLRWRKTAEAAGREPCEVLLADGAIHTLVQKLRPAYDFLIIDAPGHMDTATTALVAVADVVLLPIQPSAVDLWACETALNWIAQRQMITGGAPLARFVLSRCNPDERVSRDDVSQIRATGVPILTARTVQRVNYARTMAEGGTVFDLPDDDKARLEISAIHEELLHELEQLGR